MRGGPSIGTSEVALTSRAAEPSFAASGAVDASARTEASASVARLASPGCDSELHEAAASALAKSHDALTRVDVVGCPASRASESILLRDILAGLLMTATEAWAAAPMVHTSRVVTPRA